MSTASDLPAELCPTCGEACVMGDPVSRPHTCPCLSLTPRRSSASQRGRGGRVKGVGLELLDALSLARPLRKLLLQRDSPSVLSSSLALAVTPGEAELARVGVPWLGRLALEARLQQLAAEVQERVWLKLEALQEEVRRRSLEVRRARLDSDRMHREKLEAEERAAQLERQVDVSVEMLASLKHQLKDKDQQLRHKQQEVCDLDRFVRDTAFQEASAKIRLQSFIEDLLERAERAETQLQNIHNHLTSPHRATGYQRSYSVSGMSRKSSSSYYDPRGASHFRCEARPRTLSMGSGGCEDHWDGPLYQYQYQYDGDFYSPWPVRRTRTDSDNCSVYTPESQEEPQRHASFRTYSRAGEGLSALQWRGNRASEPVLNSERLRLKAAMFCVFTYLDTRSLILAAEVCKDWCSVARHPAVWTRVTLENARVSTKFLITLSQWCSQTQSLVLHNLKPRARGKKESKEEYLKSTRGCLEVGLEAVLKSAGRSLVTLSVSHCPNSLTDRCLWLVSCHCRSLQSLTYRSASDPVGQEVIWALGAGCRDITSLWIAPLQPCLQPARFSNRCLQTVGRCWPNLCRVGVGGAGCGVQGLASLARNCANLCVLELENMPELNQEGATELCRDGLQQLHTLSLISTPVTARAIQHFKSVCVNLKRVVVQLSITDYFHQPDSDEAKRLFQEIVNNLQVLRKKPGLSDTLQIKVEKT